MKNVIVVLPRAWDIQKIRYLQADISEPMLLDADEIDTPIDSQFSLFNHRLYTLKHNGPTGFSDVRIG